MLRAFDDKPFTYTRPDPEDPNLVREEKESAIFGMKFFSARRESPFYRPPTLILSFGGVRNYEMTPEFHKTLQEGLDRGQGLAIDIGAQHVVPHAQLVAVLKWVDGWLAKLNPLSSKQRVGVYDNAVTCNYVTIVREKGAWAVEYAFDPVVAPEEARFIAVRLERAANLCDYLNHRQEAK